MLHHFTINNYFSICNKYSSITAKIEKQRKNFYIIAYWCRLQPASLVPKLVTYAQIFFDAICIASTFEKNALKMASNTKVGHCWALVFFGGPEIFSAKFW